MICRDNKQFRYYLYDTLQTQLTRHRLFVCLFSCLG